jgi:hypothetical protein
LWPRRSWRSPWKQADGNHLYECMHIIRSNTTHDENLQAIKCYKAKLVPLHTLRMNNVLLDNSAHDKIDWEEPTLFHILKMERTTRTTKHPRVSTPTRQRPRLHRHHTHLRKAPSRKIQTHSSGQEMYSCQNERNQATQPNNGCGYNMLRDPLCTTDRRSQQGTRKRRDWPGVLYNELENHTNRHTSYWTKCSCRRT